MGRINIKGKRRWCLNYAQTCLRIWKKHCAQIQCAVLLVNMAKPSAIYKTQRQSPVLFWSGFNWVRAPPSIFHTFTQESLPIYTGLMTRFLWLSLLFHLAINMSLNCYGMIYLRWQWWWRRRERSLSWLIQWHLSDPPIDQMNFLGLFIINISTIVIVIKVRSTSSLPSPSSSSLSLKPHQSEGMDCFWASIPGF